jgi:hypothetical protein
MLTVVMLSVIMLSVVMLSIFMLSVIILSVVMLSVIAPEKIPSYFIVESFTLFSSKYFFREMGKLSGENLKVEPIFQL